MSLCIAILKSSKRQGLPCNKKAVDESLTLCKAHSRAAAPEVAPEEPCVAILRTGKRKGLACGKKAVADSLCKIHGSADEEETCTAVLKSGKRQGLACGKKTAGPASLCKIHEKARVEAALDTPPCGWILQKKIADSFFCGKNSLPDQQYCASHQRCFEKRGSVKQCARVGAKSDKPCGRKALEPTDLCAAHAAQAQPKKKCVHIMERGKRKGIECARAAIAGLETDTLCDKHYALQYPTEDGRCIFVLRGGRLCGRRALEGNLNCNTHARRFEKMRADMNERLVLDEDEHKVFVEPPRTARLHVNGERFVAEGIQSDTLRFKSAPHLKLLVDASDAYYKYYLSTDDGYITGLDLRRAYAKIGRIQPDDVKESTTFIFWPRLDEFSQVKES